MKRELWSNKLHDALYNIAYIVSSSSFDLWIELRQNFCDGMYFPQREFRFFSVTRYDDTNSYFYCNISLNDIHATLTHHSDIRSSHITGSFRWVFVEAIYGEVFPINDGTSYGMTHTIQIVCDKNLGILPVNIVVTSGRLLASVVFNLIEI